MINLVIRAGVAVLTATVFAGALNAQGKFDPSTRISADMRTVIDLIMNHQLRVLGLAGLPNVQSIDNDQYTNIHRRFYCFLNLMTIGSEREFDRMVEEFAELIANKRAPCEGYQIDGGIFVEKNGEARFRPYSRKPISPFPLRSN
jgi:hypothetical protein